MSKSCRNVALCFSSLNYFNTMKKILLVLCVFIMSCQGHFEDQTKCYTIKGKHIENEPTGVNGNFQVKHYLYMTDGSLQDVNLETYLKYEPGQQVCFTENVWVTDK